MKSPDKHVFAIGYNLAWRVIFFVFAVYLLLSPFAMLLYSLLGAGDDLTLPVSLLIASIFVALYLMPLISTRQQSIDVVSEGLRLSGENSNLILPWNTITDVKFKRVMLLMPYLIVSLSDKEAYARFLDNNPRSFLAKWTSHVGVFKRYPLMIRWLFSVPKNMTTVNMLTWLEKRYGGAIVIDIAAANGRGRELHSLLAARIGS